MGNTAFLKSRNIGRNIVKVVNDCAMSGKLSLISMVFCGQGQMLLQYIHFVNHCMNGSMCPLFYRTVNWPSVPAATLFPQGPKSPPTRATKPSGGLVPGLRLVVLSYLQYKCLLR